MTMRTSSITFEGVEYKNPKVEVNGFTVSTIEYKETSTLTAEVILTDGVTGHNTMAILSLRVDAITIEAVEKSAIDALTT